MKRRSRKGDINFTDDIVYEILLRLPGKSVLRLRLVSKLWSTIISNPAFRQAHSLRAKPALLMIDKSSRLCALPLHSIGKGSSSINGDEDQIARLTDQVMKIGGEVAVLEDCCDGLILWTVRDKRKTEQCSSSYIHNPLTAEWLPLPSPPRGGTMADCPGQVCGFYFHPASGEYRLLRHFGERDRVGSSSFSYKILTVGAREWRRIECLYDGPPTPSLIASTRAAPPELGYLVKVHGNLHWLQASVSEGEIHASAILVFDINSERFREKAMPPELTLKDGYDVHLMELHGELGILDIVASMKVNLWILEDYSGSLWTMKYLIHAAEVIPKATLSAWGTDIYVWAVSGDQDALVEYICWDVDLVLNLVYNLKDKTWRKIDANKLQYSYLTNMKYKESLVQHDFFKHL